MNKQVAGRASRATRNRIGRGAAPSNFACVKFKSQPGASCAKAGKGETVVPELTTGNAFGFLLTDTSRLFRQFFERIVSENGLGLTPGEIRALGYVIRFRGSRQAVLAERMGVEPMTLSAYLDRLEGRGLILRAVDASDRRAKLIEPTDAAFQIMQTLDPLFDQIYCRVTEGLTKDEMETIASALQKMRSNLTNDPQIIARVDLLHPVPPTVDTAAPRGDAVAG